jgi:hypothetical protein
LCTSGDLLLAAGDALEEDRAAPLLRGRDAQPLALPQLDLGGDGLHGRRQPVVLVLERVVARQERHVDVALRVVVRKGRGGGRRPYAIEDVVVPERLHLDQAPLTDQLDQLAVVVGDGQGLLLGLGDLDGQEPVAVRVVPQLVRHGHLGPAAHGLAPVLLHP